MRWPYRKKKLQFASTELISQFPLEISEISRNIAQIVKDLDTTEEEWMAFFFVSDESRVVEFLSDDSELEALRLRLDLSSLEPQDLVIEVAKSLRKRRVTVSA